MARRLRVRNYGGWCGHPITCNFICNGMEKYTGVMEDKSPSRKNIEGWMKLVDRYQFSCCLEIIFNLCERWEAGITTGPEEDQHPSNFKMTWVGQQGIDAYGYVTFSFPLAFILMCHLDDGEFCKWLISWPKNQQVIFCYVWDWVSIDCYLLSGALYHPQSVFIYLFWRKA